MFIRACRNLTLESAHRDRAGGVCHRQTDRINPDGHTDLTWGHWSLPSFGNTPGALLSLSLPMNKPTHGPGTGALPAPMADPLKEAFRAMLHRNSGMP